MRPLLFAANWKMQVDPSEAQGYAERFLGATSAAAGRSLWFFPPAVSLQATAAAFGQRADVRIGAQDVHWEPKGAFTGATSIPLARAVGATGALVGHSERRHVFGETDQDAGRKVRALLGAGLTPFLCVGEKLEERDAGETESVVLRQLRTGLEGVPPTDLPRLVVAYEPVWAIGTGKNATPDDAARVHAILRLALQGMGAKGRIPILYGGSVNQGNALSLLAQPEIDGVLVGGASLDPDGWAEITALGG